MENVRATVTARSESVVSPLSPGAGRIWDMTWPDPQYSTTVPPSARNRQGATFPASSGAKGGSGATGIASISNVDVINFAGGVTPGAGPYVTFGSAMRAHVMTARGVNVPTVCNDFAAWRWINTCAYSVAAPVANTDFGMSLICGTTEAFPGIFSDNSQGFGFSLTADGAISLVVRGPLGLVITPLTAPATFNPMLFHTYEFRTVDATATTDAVLKVLIDGNQVTALSWSAGTSLPVSQVGGGFGFWPNLMNTSENTSMYVYQIRAMASQTEAGLL